MSEDDLPEVLFRARLYRMEKDIPWGFRLQGGVEFNTPLTLLKVIPESIAAKVGLNAGDILVRLAGRSADSMTHRDAQQAIVNSGNSLEIIVERADVTCSSSQCIGQTLSDKGQLEVKDSNSEKLQDEKQNDLTGFGLAVEEDGIDAIVQNSDNILKENEIPPSEMVLSRKNSSSSSPQMQPGEEASSTSTPATSSVIPGTQTTLNNIPKTSLADELFSSPVSSSFSSSSNSVSSPGTNGAEERQSEGNGLPENSPPQQQQQQAAVLQRDNADEGVGKREEVNDEEQEEVKMAMTLGTVYTDQNDNIPLNPIETQNIFPVRALLKTSALTSELGDESSEGADDQSSEFSDDISVIELQTESGETNTVKEEPGDELETIPDTDALFYQDETECREISLLNFGEKLLEVTRAAAETDPEGDMNRMRACFYLPSLVSEMEHKTVATAGDVQQPEFGNRTTPGESVERSSRDFSQTAPWRHPNKTATSGSRRAEDDAASRQSQSAAQGESLTPSSVSSYDPRQQRMDYSVRENVILVPISIFGQQLKLGSDYTFQRITPTTQQTQQTQEQPTSMSVTPSGRRTEQPVAISAPLSTTIAVVRLPDHGQATQTVAISTASATVTMATARVYIAPIMSQSSGRPPAGVSYEGAVPVASSTLPSSEPRRLSSEVLSDLQDIPLPPVKDIVADLNSRLEKVAERYEASPAAASQSLPSRELGTSFGRPERRRSSSGSDSEKEIIIDTPPFSEETRGLLKERLLGDEPPTTYRSVIYRSDLSPKSVRRFSLPGGSVTAKDNTQRRVRFAEPPESSVIEIEGRQKHWSGDRVRPVGGGSRVASRLDDVGHASDAEYVSVSSLAEKLDRIELENALASAAMKRSRPFQAQVSSLLASHPVAHSDIRASSPSRSAGLVGRSGWKLEPIQERVINIQTYQPPEMRRDERQFRISTHKPPVGTVRCASEISGGFSLSIGPGSGGQLSLSVQPHPNHGARQGYPPTKVNFVLPTSGEIGKTDQFSYSVSTGIGLEPIRYTLPPTYEESVRAMAAGRHPRSSSLDDAKQVPVAPAPAAVAAAAAAAYPARVTELRAESQMTPVNLPHQPGGIRMIRAQSPSISCASHPGWVISTASPGLDPDPRREGYSQTLQVDTGSKQSNRPLSASFGLPVFHTRSGALSSEIAGYQATVEGPQPTEQLLRIMSHPSRARQTSSGDLSRSDMAARLYRSGSPLILSPTGSSNPASASTLQQLSPIASVSSPDRRWPPHRPPDSLGQGHAHLPGTIVTAEPSRERRWPTTSALRSLVPTAPHHQHHQQQHQQQHLQQPYIHEQLRTPGSPSTARMFPEGRGMPPQRMPGIFALLDKTFTDKVLQWEASHRSGGLQQSETYKLVREMDDAMKQDKH